MKAHDPHIVDAVYQLKHEGKCDAEIAAAVGLTEGQVRGLCRKRGLKRPVPNRIDIPVGAEVVAALKIEASARGKRFDAFLRKLLENIVEDKLYAAILEK
jgi:hypothetical protein